MGLYSIITIVYIGLNVFISILLQHVSHITTCKFLGLERKHIAYLVLLLLYIFNLKVGSCINDDNSVHKIFISFSYFYFLTLFVPRKLPILFMRRQLLESHIPKGTLTLHITF